MWLILSRFIKSFSISRAQSKKNQHFPPLDPVEQKLLALLSKYWSQQEKITVVEAMHMSSDISTSTIFRYLKKLRHKGYIELVVDNLDNRVKYILATPLTDSYFTKMGKLMVKAME